MDHELAFAQAPTDTDACLRIPTGFHMQDDNGNDVSNECCLKLLKNCYGTKDAAANWFSVLQKSLEQRGFKQNVEVDPCLFTRNDCIIVACVDDRLVFYKNKRVLDELIESLNDEFKLTDEGDLETFLGIQFKRINHNTLEMSQPRLIQRMLDALGFNDDSKMHDAPANAILHKDKKGKQRAQN